MLLVGLVLGWPGAMYALVYGMLLAGLPALALILARRGNRYFAYGPYLVGGALLVLLFPGWFD
jgi:prepilin signal peptidase PulO-like enzyme (type II secretory pathway)